MVCCDQRNKPVVLNDQMLELSQPPEKQGIFSYSEFERKRIVSDQIF